MKTAIANKHEGQLLMDYVREKGMTRNEISKKLNISVPMFAYHCRKQTLSGSFKAKLLGIGVPLFSNDAPPADSPEEYIKELEEEVKLLTQVLAIQKQFISHVTQNCKHGHCLNYILDNRKS